MTIIQTSHTFKTNAKDALKDERLQKAMGNVKQGFIGNRARARDELPEFDALRDNARDIKNHVLENLDIYLEKYEERVVESGGSVHWAVTAEDAQDIITGICERVNAKVVTKGKSMVSEEINLNQALEDKGFEAVETDLREYIIQLRGETPSHVIAPALHVNKEDVEADFRENHTHLPTDRNLDEPTALLGEARSVLRGKFLESDVGITGANFLIAETGTSIIVTNEGNGDLTQILPKVHIVIASIEKIVPTLNDVSQILRVLARSATGQDLSVYTTFSTGAKRAGDVDGPEEYHVILLDNGRSNMLGSEFEEALRCIRCGACMNHCPVFQNVGGHAYGWVYPGPIGAVITPALTGIENSQHLPSASSFCGRCEAVCPMRIPLPKMMRSWREKEFEKHLTPTSVRFGLRIWGRFARWPSLYRFGTNHVMSLLSVLGRKKGKFSKMPLASGWTAFRDLPAPQGKTFQSQYKKSKRN